VVNVTLRPQATGSIGPNATGVIVPNANADSGSQGLSGTGIIILSCLGAAVVLAGLGIFAFKYYVSRPKRRNAKVELGDAFGRPLTDSVFGDSNGSVPRLEQILQPKGDVVNGEYYQHPNESQKYYSGNQSFYSNASQQFYQPQEYYQNYEGQQLTVNEYLAVNGGQWNQQYQQYYEHADPSQFQTEQGVPVATDPFADESSGFTYPTQNRYEAVNALPSDPSSK
jgi:hypothetical protein